MARTRTQYRVISERGEGLDYSRTVKTCGSLKTVERRIVLLGPEPWKAYTDEDPDSLKCCEGGLYQECGCGGLTWRQDSDEKRKTLPPITSIRVEKRTVTTTAWESLASDEHALAPPVRPAGTTGSAT